MRRRGWAYHLTTIGSILTLVTIVLLVCAGLGLLLGEVSRDGAVPGRGVTPIPAPQWSPAPR